MLRRYLLLPRFDKELMLLRLFKDFTLLKERNYFRYKSYQVIYFLLFNEFEDFILPLKLFKPGFVRFYYKETLAKAMVFFSVFLSIGSPLSVFWSFLRLIFLLWASVLILS